MRQGHEGSGAFPLLHLQVDLLLHAPGIIGGLSGREGDAYTSVA